MLLGILTPAARADEDLGSAYSRAAEFVPWRVGSWLTQNATYAAQWSKDGRGFTWWKSGPDGQQLMRGDARTGRVVEAPTRSDASEPSASLSPSGAVALGLQDFNLWAIDSRTGERIALTRDGTASNAYSALYEFGVLLESERRALRGPMRPAQGVWSPDGRWFATFRYDQRAVGKTWYWNAVTSKGLGARPELLEQLGAWPGEPNAFAVLVIVDTRDRSVRTIDAARFETFLDPISAGLVQWSAGGDALYYLQEGKGLRSVAVTRIDPVDGTLKVLFEERSSSYLMLSGSRYPAIWRVLADGKRILWYSERDGWGNLYSIDLLASGARSSAAVRQVTTGPGVVTDLLRVDEFSGWIYFLAAGRDPTVDPYFRQAWRAHLTGGPASRLTDEPADHFVSMPAKGEAFLDVSSKGVGAPPRTVLRALDGRQRAVIATTDDAPLRARNWRAPERAKVRSADDRYDVYVTIFRPSDYDSSKRYPVLDYVYGLSSLALTPRIFPLGPGFEIHDSYWHSVAMAELGFVVVKLDAPGTPLRGHAFARESYGAGHVGAMLEHHIAAIRQLAQRDSSLDLDRVGIFGSSGGGYTSTRAMLLQPDFFKSAVAFSSSQDLLRIYGPEWGERYIGPYEGNEKLYEQMSNSTYAARLRGDLLIVHGEADTEVSILNDQQFVHALIQANRNFDMLYIPNAEHDLDSNPYAVRRRWDFFVEHLLKRAPPDEFTIPAPGASP